MNAYEELYGDDSKQEYDLWSRQDNDTDRIASGLYSRLVDILTVVGTYPYNK